MSIIEQIKAEIERRFLEYNQDSNHHIQAAECASILDFLDTLESEKPMNQDAELNDEKWTSSKVAKPEKTGLYLITDGSHWRVLLVNNGDVMIYEDWDDSYTTDKNYLNREWWWRPLPNLPSGKTPYYYE